MYPIFVRLVRVGRAPDDRQDIAVELSAAGQRAFEHAYFRQQDDRVEGVVFVLAGSAADALSSVRDSFVQLVETTGEQQWHLEDCELDLLYVNAFWSAG